MDGNVIDGPPAFRRVLLKLSGESFCRPGEGGISVEEVSRIARQASRVASRGVQLAIVVGGGNILRGAQLSRGSDVIKEATAHYMGMTATVINGLALQDALESMGCETRLMTTIRMEEVAEPFIRRRALSHLGRGRVIILATRHRQPVRDDRHGRRAAGQGAGRRGPAQGHSSGRRLLGRPGEEPARGALRAPDLRAGPARQLKVMDMTAIGMCMENNLPILVFNFKKEGNIERAVMGEPIGTWVSNVPRPRVSTARDGLIEAALACAWSLDLSRPPPVVIR